MDSEILGILILAAGYAVLQFASQYLTTQRLADLADKLEKSIPAELGPYLPYGYELAENAVQEGLDAIEDAVLATPGLIDDQLWQRVKEAALKIGK
jgi:hypothetical protein